jgi:hypothetical protein
VELLEPGANLLVGLRVMNFHDEGRPLFREQACAAKENFALSALHIDLNELRHEAAAGDETVECDGRHTDQVAVCQDRVLSAGFHSAGGSRAAPAKADFRAGRAGPNGGVDRSKY